MDDSSDRELEQLERIEQLRKLVQAILSNYIWLLVVVFVLFLALSLAYSYMSVTRANDRYQATIVLHYYPKNTQRIQSYDAKYLVQMFNRQALIHKFFKEMSDELSANKVSASRIMVGQERKQNNSIIITLYARTENDAITLTNSFAQFCIREYTSERINDLQKWKDALLQQKQDTFKEIQRINLEMDKLTVPLNVASPEKEYERLRFTLGEKQANLVKLTLQVTNQQRKKEKLEEEMGTLNPSILLYEKEIRSFTNSLKKIEADILALNELYTEENPKMKVIMAQKKALQESYDSFLREKKISFFDIDSIGKLDRITTELRTVSDELSVKEEELRLLKAEVSSDSEKFSKLNEIIPRYQQLRQQSTNLLDSIQKVDDNIADINYILLLVKDDLFVGEQIETAIGESWLNKKSIFVSCFAAIVMTGVLALLTVLIEFKVGKVANASELELYSDFVFLGTLPNSEDKLKGGDKKNNITLNGICHRFQNTGVEHHIVMVGMLPGAKIIQGLFENIAWNYAMAGKEVLIIDIVEAKDFNENTPMSDTCIVSYREWSGLLPLESVKHLPETELQLLKQDLKVLRKKYALIFIRQNAALDALFLKRIAEVCDGLLIGVGAKATKRKSLRALGKVFIKENKPIMTVLTVDSKYVAGSSGGWEI